MKPHNLVIEFDRNEKRIVLSHTRIWEQAKAEEKDVARKEAKTDADKPSKAVKTIQNKVENQHSRSRSPC
jgi:small subunit ribosomal protein S1